MFSLISFFQSQIKNICKFILQKKLNYSDKSEKNKQNKKRKKNTENMLLQSMQKKKMGELLGSTHAWKCSEQF